MKSKWNPSGVLITENLLDANERIAAMEAELATLRAELERVTAERDTARAAASAWKRSAKMWRHQAWVIDYRDTTARYLYKSARFGRDW